MDEKILPVSHCLLITTSKLNNCAVGEALRFCLRNAALAGLTLSVI